MDAEQSRQALAKANQIRQERAHDKRLIKDGQLDVAVLMVNLPKHWESASVGELLTCIPQVGKSKARALLRPLAIDPLTRLGRMSLDRRLVVSRQVAVSLRTTRSIIENARNSRQENRLSGDLD
jgi:hypothetical protein